MGPIQNFQDILGMLRRRLFVMAPVFMAGIAISLVYALSLPRAYEATAVIQIDSLLASGEARTDPAAAAQRLQLIQQRMFTRENLTEVAETYNLFADAPQLSPTERIGILRQAVKIDNVTTTNAFGASLGVSALIVTAQMGEPVQAAQVANDFAERVVALNTTSQAARTRETLDFYQQEEARLTSEMTAIEADLTAYKNANLEALPTGQENRRSELTRLDELLRETDQRLLELTRERNVLEGERPIRAVSQRQIEVLNGQISVQEEQKARLEARRLAIESAMARAPGVEMVLSTYERRLEQVSDQLSVVTRRRAEAETTQRLEATDQAERFVILENALPPEYPMRSARRKIMAAGTMASVGIALILALVLELLNPVLRTPAHFERTVGLVPVVSIPYVDTRAEQDRRRMRRSLGFGGIAIIILLFLVLTLGS